jgi:hypothetical protein
MEDKMVNLQIKDSFIKKVTKDVERVAESQILQKILGVQRSLLKGSRGRVKSLSAGLKVWD